MLQTLMASASSAASLANECDLQALHRGTSVRVAHAAEPSLISWDEVEAPEDVYQAVTLADGRPALIKGRSGDIIRISRKLKRFVLESLWEGLDLGSHSTALGAWHVGVESVTCRECLPIVNEGKSAFLQFVCRLQGCSQGPIGSLSGILKS